MKIHELLESEQRLPGLTLGQSMQVMTPQFKAWFGDWQNDNNNSSIALNYRGVPQVFYRGNKADYGPIFKHDISQRRTYNSFGFFFTDSPQIAALYATSAGSHTQPVFLNIRHILNLSKHSGLSINLLESAGVTISEQTKEHLYKSPATKQFLSRRSSRLKGQEMSLDSVTLHPPRFLNEGGSSLRSDIIAAGYDSVYFQSISENYIVVFHPNQIKSAIGNNGNYDLNKDSIIDEE